MRAPRPTRALPVAVAAVSIAALATGCSTTSASARSGGGSSLNLVAYSTPQQAYSALIPQFTATAGGKGVSFRQSYGASGSQSRAVLAGQPADVVEFSLEPDMSKLVDAGLVASDWNSGQYKGIVTDSVVVFVVRKGNPRHITGWNDLVKPGIKVVTPNVFSSGSAKWNLMAAYGSQIKQGRTPAEALAFVKAVLKNTVAQPESGSKATEAFVGGTGDVLISYENEAIKAQQGGADVDYVTPDQTILIENPIAVTKSAPAAAQQFVSFLYTDAAQKTFAKYGYRPVVTADLDKSRFPTPRQLFTIDDLGGWSTVNKQFFDPTNGSISKIENELGVSGG
ncbi:MAG TPA: sulfate ABC transporter substrate-binding protein [Mycobacteriales bacterium]|nr:sulfate ABC transporter substrate-binding protein [Mycobacteriales bacterium]